MKNSIPPRRQIKTCWRKFEMLLVVLLSFLHAEQLLKLFSENLEKYANQLSGLMLANYTRTRCVNLCPPVFIRGGIWIHRKEDSHLDETRPLALKIWSCHFLNKQDQNTKLRASTQQVDRNVTPSVLIVSALIATLRSKQSVALTTSVPVKKFVRLSVNTIFNAVVKRENLMNWGKTIYKKKASLLPKCRTVNGGDCIRQAIMSENISDQTFLTDIHLQLSNY